MKKGDYTSSYWRQFTVYKWLDPNQVTALGSLGCTMEDAALVLGVSVAKFRQDMERSKKLRESWERGQAQGRVSLRMRRWRQGEMMNSAGVTMNIHLSKHMLGEHEKAELRHEVNILGRLLQEIDGQSRSIPEANQRMIDVTPSTETSGPNAILDQVVKKDET